MLLALLSLLLTLSAPPVARAAEPGSLDLSALAATAAIASAEEAVADLQKSCLDGKTKKRIASLADGLAMNKANLNTRVQRFKTEVAKPIEGNGRCDGGFQSVAQGSFDRVLMTYNTLDQGYTTSLNIARGYGATVFDSPVGFEAKGDGGKCIMSGMEKLNGVQKAMLPVLPAMEGVIERIHVEKDRLTAYHAKNMELAARCGSSVSLTGAAGAKASAAGQPGFDGRKNPKDESQVTGKLNQDMFGAGTSPLKVDTQKLGGGVLEKSAAAPATGTSPSNITGRSASSKPQPQRGLSRMGAATEYYKRVGTIAESPQTTTSEELKTALHEFVGDAKPGVAGPNGATAPANGDPSLAGDHPPQSSGASLAGGTVALQESSGRESGAGSNLVMPLSVTSVNEPFSAPKALPQSAQSAPQAAPLSSDATLFARVSARYRIVAKRF